MLALGLYAMWRERHDPCWRPVGLGLRLAPVPGALTIDFRHPIRELEAAPFWLLIACLGTAGPAAALGALAITVAVEASTFVSDYFTRYPERIAGWSEEGLDRAVVAAARLRTDPASNGSVVISDKVFGAEIAYAYDTREDIRLYGLSGITGVGARVAALSGRLAPGTVALTTADEQVPSADALDHRSRSRRSTTGATPKRCHGGSSGARADRARAPGGHLSQRRPPAGRAARAAPRSASHAPRKA